MSGEKETAIDVKKKMEALKKDLVLRQIIGFLPITDMRSCRLVNSTWLDAANSELREAVTNCPTIDKAEGVRSFLEFWGRDNKSEGGPRPHPPFTRISLDLTDLWCEDKEILLECFFQTVAPFVVELRLGVCLTNPVYIFNNQEVNDGLSYPNLTDYSVTVEGFMPKSEGIYKRLSCGILENSPNLRQLAYHSGIFTHGVSSYEYLHWLIDTLKNRKWGHQKIKSLEIQYGIEDAHYSRMVVELPELKLETFRVDNCVNNCYVDVDETGFFRFLQGQSESLKFLLVRNVIGCFENVGVPTMKKLETLHVENWTPLHENPYIRGLHANGQVTLRKFEVVPNLDFAKQLPALNKIIFADFFDNDAWIQFIPSHGSSHVASVEVLKFLSNVGSTVNIEHCISTFQSLRILQIPVTLILANLVYKYLPQLEELILDTSDDTNVDHIITGFSNEECDQVNQFTEKMWRRLRLNFEEDDTEEVELWPVSEGPMVQKPISVLKKLKVLRLISKFQPNKVELTKASSGLVLGKMKSLQILDLGIRSSAALQGFAEVIIDMEKAGKVVQYESKFALNGNDDESDNRDDYYKVNFGDVDPVELDRMWVEEP